MIVSKMAKNTKRLQTKTKREVRFASNKVESSDDLDVDDDVENTDGNESSDDENLGSDNVDSGNDDPGSTVDQSDEENTDDDDENADDNEENSKSNPGWADAMQKILNAKKPKRKKSIVLSKAKKLCDVKSGSKEKDPGFEIDGQAVVDEKSEQKTIIKEEKEAEHSRRKRRETDLGLRVKPSILDRERERALQKIATKGVVQLFNVVRKQQKDIQTQLEAAGPLERKRELVMKNIDKRAFLDVLMGGAKSIPVDGPVKNEKSEKQEKSEKDDDDKTWDVLRDDFMMGAKLKDWDKQNEEDENSSAPEEMDSDD